MSMGPSFDDVPASAAPNRQLAASYSYPDRSQSPIFSNNPDTTGRPSLDSPYRYARERWSRDLDMNTAHRPGLSTDLPPLQAQGNLDDRDREAYDPIQDDDPTSYDLVAPDQPDESRRDTYSLERRAQALFSKEHLQIIFGDPTFLLRFTSFLGLHRPQSVPILVHYLDSLKALRALHYANAILEGLDEVPGLDFTNGGVEPTSNPALLKRATDAFDYLVREELPAYVTYEYIQIVSASIVARISGLLAPHLREASEGLAEVFCLTDPSRADNPIVFASEEFNRTTQYGMSYILGRNCRFLQGPYTNPLSVRRLRDASKAGKQHQEVLLNYRRDGSPFMNLLMIAPLCDARGIVRYYIGAQVDVTGLVKECSEMESLERLLETQSRDEQVPDHQRPNPDKNDELRELSEMLNQNELSTIRRYGGRMHKDMDYEDDARSHIDEGSVTSNQPRLLIKDPNTLTPPLEYGPEGQRLDGNESPIQNGGGRNPPAPESVASSTAGSAYRLSGRLSGIYNHYLLIRPYPSLRILFASPSQRVPGILQSPFMNKIGGSNRVREELTAALADGRGVTAKVRWVSKHDEEGRNKWIHCTPLLGLNGQIGVWMVIIVDDERHKVQRQREGLGGRTAPPVAPAGDSRSRATSEKLDGSRGQGQGQRTREAATPNRTSQAGGREQNAASRQASASAHRYGYSTGEKGTVVSDRTRLRGDSIGGGESVNSFQI